MSAAVWDDPVGEPIVTTTQIVEALLALRDQTLAKLKRAFHDPILAEDAWQDAIALLIKEHQKNPKYFASWRPLWSYFSRVSFHAALRERQQQVKLALGHEVAVEESCDRSSEGSRFQARLLQPDEAAELRALAAVLEQLTPLEQEALELFLSGRNGRARSSSEQKQRRRMIKRLRGLLVRAGFRERCRSKKSGSLRVTLRIS